jgi:hypothetical protein
LLNDEQATVAAIEERFGQLAGCSADDVVVVAFQVMGPRHMNLSDLTPIQVT